MNKKYFPIIALFALTLLISGFFNPAAFAILFIGIVLAVVCFFFVVAFTFR